MGYVLRDCGEAYVRADNFAIVYDNKKLEALKAEGNAVKKRVVGIVIYSEEDFAAFYNKHCAHIPNDNSPFTVMVVDNVNVPSRQDVRELMEEALRRNTTKLETGWFSNIGKIVPKIEPTWFATPHHRVRTFFQGGFQDEPRKGRFRFRDVQQIFPRDLLDVFTSGHIPKLELQNLQNIWNFSIDNSLDNNRKVASMCEYAVLYLWIIGHTDIMNYPIAPRGGVSVRIR
ncbi:hypothetical protein J4211_02080 [Candidatus Woesearchaeota archaeon]|nr:hypothetical protein [Candidatus Woesearchaeota archaeon]